MGYKFGRANFLTFISTFGYFVTYLEIKHLSIFCMHKHQQIFHDYNTHQSMHKKEKSKTKQVLATLKHQLHTFWWLAAEHNSVDKISR